VDGAFHLIFLGDIIKWIDTGRTCRSPPFDQEYFRFIYRWFGLSYDR